MSANLKCFVDVLDRGHGAETAAAGITKNFQIVKERCQAANCHQLARRLEFQVKYVCVAFLTSTFKSAFAETLIERPPGSRAGSVWDRRRNLAEAVRYYSIMFFIAGVVQPWGYGHMSGRIPLTYQCLLL